MKWGNKYFKAAIRAPPSMDYKLLKEEDFSFLYCFHISFSI